MILRWFGVLLTLFAAAGMGLWSAWCWRGRLGTLEELRRMVYFLKGEITYSRAPLKEALERVGRRGEGGLGALFLRTAERIGDGQGELFGEIWSGEVCRLEQEEGGGKMSPADLEQLSRLGEYLGYLDVDMQERTLLLYLEELDGSIGYLRSYQREKCRLYASLGMLGGLFLVIAIY